MTTTAAVILGGAAAFAVSQLAKKNLPVVGKGNAANNPILDHPIGTNDYLRGVIPANLRQYVPNSASGAVAKYLPDNTAQYATAGAAILKTGFDFYKQIETGNPKTPSSNPKSPAWNPDQVGSAAGETEEFGNPISPDPSSFDGSYFEDSIPDYSSTYIA